MENAELRSREPEIALSTLSPVRYQEATVRDDNAPEGLRPI
jgi:hypothetical protein